MSSSSTKNVHLKGEKEKVPLRKITSQPSKAKYNAPLEGRKSPENVASTHRTNNLRNSLSSSKVPIRLESRTGGCSKSNSEVMINENSNKSKGNSKRKIIDHLNSRESHPHGKDKVNAHLSEKKFSQQKRNSALQINITENISHSRHSRSSSSKEGNEHMKRHGQGRIEPKKMLPCKSILKKFSQSDLHLNKFNLYSASRKTNFDSRKITNQFEKQSNLRKVSFEKYSTVNLTKDSNESKESLLLRKRYRDRLVKHGSSGLEIQSGDNLIETKPCKSISDRAAEEIIHNASQNMSDVLSVELRKNSFEENETNLNEHEDNKKANNESKFMENNLEVSDCIKLSSGTSPNIDETSISKTDFLHTNNNYDSRRASERKVFEKEINEKIKFLTEKYKKNMNLNQRPILMKENNDRDYQEMGDCGDYKIDEYQMNLSSTFESSDKNINESDTNVDNIKIEDNCNVIKKLGRKQLLENEINEKIRRLTTKFKENQSKIAFSDVVANKEENLKLTDIKCNEDKLIILNSSPYSNDIKLNGSQKISIDDSNKIHKEFPSNLSSSGYFNKNSINFDYEEYNNYQTDFESTSSKSLTSTKEIGPATLSRIPRSLNSKSPNVNGQSNEGPFQKMANGIFLVFSKQNETGDVEKNYSKTEFDENADFDRSPFTSPGSKDLTKSLRCSKIPRSLRSKSGRDSPLSGDFKNVTFLKRKKITSPTNDVLDASEMELSSYVQEQGSRDEHHWKENELNNLNERSSAIEEFDGLIKDKGNIENLNNPNHFDRIALKYMQRKRKNKKEESNKRDMISSKSEENLMNYCNENDLNTLQFGKSDSATEVSIADDGYSFYRHFQMLFLLGLICFCFLLLKLLFDAPGFDY